MKPFFRPLQDWFIHQKFGENKACVDLATGSKVITCDGNNPPAGYRSLYGPKGHNGLDLRAPTWTKVYSIYDGKVVEKQTTEQRGLGIGILHFVDGKYFKSRYWHLAAMDVDMGEQVFLGDFIGYADNTGFSSGSHLHFELGFCDKNGNEYMPIDPELYLNPTFALDAKTQIKWIREQIALIADKLADIARGRL